MNLIEREKRKSKSDLITICDSVRRMAMSGNVSQIGEESRSNIETLIDLLNKHDETKIESGLT